MRGQKIYRMNFLERRHGSVTYMSFAHVGIAWCVFLAILFTVQLFREMHYTRVERQKKEMAGFLDQEKNRSLELIQKVSKRRIGISAKESLSTILSNRPRWSEGLSVIVRSMPSQVSLDSVDIREDVSGEIEVMLKGKAKAQASISDFIMGLEASGAYRGTSLLSSKDSPDKKGLVDYDIITHPTSLGF